ncbi:MAG: N-acetyltransferase [Chloroflexi bacterium]|nr:N-acetyltransferase [Chloroflexota bacterium]OJV97174.1 MAG: hypothetical protein BGO39_19540 [Chloroflexi bacterium 54-19]
MPLTSRPYSGEADYGLLRQFLMENYRLGGSPDYGTVGDLDWWRFTEDDSATVMNSTRLWLDETGQVVAFAWPGEGEKPLDLFALPRYKALETELLAYSESYLLGKGGESPSSISIMSYTGDAARNTLLEKSGYSRTDDFIFYWVYDLEGEVPNPVLPEGFKFGSVLENGLDAARRVALHRAAFTASQLTPAKYQTVMDAPTYRPELDLLVVGPGDEPAAFALAWHDSANRIAMFDPVGCAAAFQRRGLTRALLLEGLRRLKELGVVTAILCSSGSEEGPTHLYRSVGFKEFARNYSWEKNLPAQ